MKIFGAKNFIEKSLEEIRAVVGEHNVISACSGGVDSTVTTFLVHKAVGDKLVAVFIDDGLRREGEPEFVVRILKESHKDIKFDIFERLNRGSVKLNEQELRNCIYRGSFNDLLKEEEEGK